MEFLSHSPPSLPKGSLEPAPWKRARAGSEFGSFTDSGGGFQLGSFGSDMSMPPARRRSNSISGRLRSASDLHESGIISDKEKGVIKDLIISEDPRLTDALAQYESGNLEPLNELVRQGALERRSSIELTSNLDVGSLDINFNEMFPTGPSAGGGVGRTRVNSQRLMSFSNADDQIFAMDGSFDIGLGDFDEGSTGNVGALYSSSLGSGRHRLFSNAGLELFDADHAVDDSPTLGPLDSSFDTDAALMFQLSHSSESLTDKSIPAGSKGKKTTTGSAASKIFSSTSRSSSSGQSKARTSSSNRRVASGATTSNGSKKGASNTAKGKSKPKVSKGKQTKPKSKTTKSPVKAKVGSSAKASSSAKKTPSKNPRSKSNASKNTKPSLGSNAAQRIAPKPGVKMIGAYSIDQRKARIAQFMAKRHKRVWTKRVKYDVRKNFADSRLRVKGRFVKKEDEELLRELMNRT